MFWASGLWTLFVGDGYIYLYIMKQYASAAWKRGGADQKVPTLVRASSTLPYAHEQFFCIGWQFWWSVGSSWFVAIAIVRVSEHDYYWLNFY